MKKLTLTEWVAIDEIRRIAVPGSKAIIFYGDEGFHITGRLFP
jgi:hypothetical protein